LGVWFVIGWIAASAYYQIPKLWESKSRLVHVETKVVPTLKRQLGCEHYVARKNEMVAQTAIVSANDDYVPTPSIHDVAKDNCDKLAKK
jgi:hypothetical protein